MLQEVINRINKDLKTFGSCQLYCHGYSKTPLNETERQQIFDKYRQIGYNITPKRNSHNVEYFLISQRGKPLYKIARKKIISWNKQT